jgi:hypothetical protein
LPRNTGLTNLNVHTIISKDGKLFAGTEAGIFVSSNDGLSWTERLNGAVFGIIKKGTVVYDVRSIAILGDNIFAGTKDGKMFKALVSDITEVDEQSSDNKISFRPNPVHSVIELNFGKTLEMPATVALFDLCGQKVIESTVPAGVTTWTINAEDLVKGIYIMQVNNMFEKVVKN